MKDEFVSRVGIWGQRHYDYLKRNKPTVINVMRMKGSLQQYLVDLNRDAKEMFELLMRQYAELEGITENLKEDTQAEWVAWMESIQARVTEVVNSELIYC